MSDNLKREYIFEMSTTVTERCKIVANSQEEAEDIILLSGDVEWEEVKSQGGDFDCISDDIMSHEKLETHYKEKIESLEHQLAEMHKTYTEMALRIHTGK